MRQFFSWGCTHCGASFTTRYKRARKFCSLQCQGASRKLTDEEYKKGLVKRFWGFVENRDWHHNPSQGNSRSAYDYGNSGPILPCDGLYPVSWKERIAASAIILAITFTLVAFWPS